jgi:hypothetical protein
MYVGHSAWGWFWRIALIALAGGGAVAALGVVFTWALYGL